MKGYDLISITEMWWDTYHDWNVGMEESRLFKDNRLGRCGGSVTVYMDEQL